MLIGCSVASRIGVADHVGLVRFDVRCTTSETSTKWARRATVRNGARVVRVVALPLGGARPAARGGVPTA